MKFRASLFGVTLFLLTLAASASDDMRIFSGRFDNGWGDSWSWMPRSATNHPVYTNNPVYVQSNSMALVPSGQWQAWWLKSGANLDTTIYTNVSFWLNGGGTGGQSIVVSGETNGTGLTGIWVTAPTNSWKQITLSLASLGLNDAPNLTGFQFGNGTSVQPFFIEDLRLVAAPAPPTVHVSVNANQAVRTVNGKIFGINQVGWDPNVNTPASVTLLNAMGNPCLRWPGGSWGDGWHWTNDTTSPGFIALATNTHSQAFIIANYGSSDPNEAAYGVRMFNITNHCNFKYWEVGNEVGGSWEWDHIDFFASNAITSLSPFAAAIYTPTNAISWFIRTNLSSSTLVNLTNYTKTQANASAMSAALINDLNNNLVAGNSIYSLSLFAGITLRPETQTNLAFGVPALGASLINRQLLEDSYPSDLARQTNAILLPNAFLPHDPWTYAMRFTNYYALMKAVDPTIKIGAVADTTEDGTSNYTNHPVVNPRTGHTHNGWTPVMLTYLRSNNCTPDFLIEHNYGPTAGDTQDLLYSKKWASDAASLRQMLSDYLGSAGSNVTLEATENGTGGDKQCVGLPGGLFYADTIGQIMQTEFNSRLWWDFRNGQSDLTDPDPAFYGWRTNSDGNFLVDGGMVYGAGGVGGVDYAYPTYYVAKLMPYFAADGDTVVSASGDYELLSVYAVKRTNGTLTLLVINKSSSSNLTAAINLSGYLPYTNATVYSYGVPQDTAAETGVSSPDIARTNISGVQASFSATFAPFSVSVMVLNAANQPPLAPANLVATASTAAVALAWSPATAAGSYLVRRSSTGGGPYTTIASGVTATNYLDTGLANGTTYYYVVAATNAYGVSANSVEASATPIVEFAGTVIGSPGSWSNQGNTIANVFDGNTNTFYDAADASGDWAGLDLGSGAAARVTQINYCPRASSGSRMVGGQFQGANVANFSSGVVTLFAISNSPPNGWTTAQNVTNAGPFRYLRYLGPANGWCNVAEVQFWGYNAVAPAAPAGLSAAAGDAQVALSWNASSGAANYYVECSTTSGSGYTIIATNADLTFTNTGLNNGTPYYYVVSAVNAFGGSTNSAEVSALPTSSAPAQLGFALLGKQLQLGWPADHTGWQLQSQTNNLASGLGTNWVNVVGSNRTNQVPVPLRTTSGSVFFRLGRPY